MTTDTETTDTATAASPKTMHVDVTPVEVQPGQKVVFTTDSSKFSKFQLTFDDPSAVSPGDKLEGTNSVEIKVEKHGTLKYSVRHFPKTGNDPVDGTFSIRSCPGGCP